MYYLSSVHLDTSVWYKPTWCTIYPLCISIHPCNKNQLDVLFILCASPYIRVIKTNLMPYLSFVYFVNQPLHVSGIFVAHHQEVYCLNTIGTCCDFQLTVFYPNPTNWQSTTKHKTYQLLYIDSIPPDDGLQICPKHVEINWRNKQRENSASSWILLDRCIEMHGQ